jgi:4-alpha-glucanotransferase
MNIVFNVDYQTRFGEDIMLNLRQEDGSVKKYRMSTVDGMRWSHRCLLPDAHDTVDYYYSVEYTGSLERHEWTTVMHRLELSASKAQNYTVYDRWLDIPEDAYLYSSAFTDCVNRRDRTKLPPSTYGKTVRLVVRAPQLRTGERLLLTGQGEALGNWNPARAKSMAEHNFNEWVIDLDAAAFGELGMEFKFVARNEKNNEDHIWETGLNRTIELPQMHEGEVVVYHLDQAFFPIYNTKLAGTLVPVFSLRSKTSFGVGDFGDLRKMVDYVEKSGQRVLQILPINDTTITHTWTDSYPYSCISVFALHPQYADLNRLPQLKDGKLRSDYAALREQLNQLPQIDYERVTKAKLDYLKFIFEQEGKAMMGTRLFKEFFAENEQWLVPYAQYSLLRDSYGTANFSQWPDHNTWNEADRKALTNPRTKAYKEVEFWYFVQYILSSQLKEVHDYARSRHVILKGDIPIGVNRYGCDVWMEPKYFNLNGQAGAPPDDFSVNGQNWGFPTYNWEEMLKDGCLWWVRRFQNMANYFDAYRIDHVLGFFRIWQIPANAVHGLLGHFQPALGMTREEIEGYGLPFNEQHFCEPFITNWILDRVFGARAEEVKEKYLNHAHDDVWVMKPDFDTQKKVEKAFEKETDQNELNLRDGLYSLISNVLFVRDANNENLFHPRISAQFNFTYEALYDKDKAAFNRLYNDYFYRRNNQFWYREAMKKLPRLIEATRMLVCAEDLGMVPDCVPWVINELKILSLEIQSMPKDPHVRFGHLSGNPYRSVCTFSTHDMATLRQWWDENYERTQDYFNSMLYHGGPAPHPLPGWLAKDIVSRQLTSPSMLCVLSLQDWLAMSERLRLEDAEAERINVPANPRHYWRYRMHINIEDLMDDEKWMDGVRELIRQCGRGV